jgi:phosphatidylinositol glycan class T
VSEPAWSLREVFGRPINGACPLFDDDSSTPQPHVNVCINAPLERTIEVRSEIPTSSSQENQLHCYELPTGADWDVYLPEQTLEKQQRLTIMQPRVHAARSINGYGAERGSIQAVITNPSATESIRIVYLESLPWYMKPYLHTLRASLSSTNTSEKKSDPVEETYYRPALDRHRGTHLEVLLQVPPASTLALTYDFEKAILRYTEYPPDANRGFDVAAAVIRLLPSSPNKKKNVYLRTTSLLLPLPTPDFSMPYNVIILTSTVMALGFGSIFNLLVRRLVAADEVGPAPIAVAIAQLRGRMKAGLRRLVGKVQRPSEKKVQ